MSKKRALLGIAVFILISGCMPTLNYVSEPEYPPDESSASTWELQLRSELKDAEFRLRRHELPPTGWRPVVTFVLASDVQIRDANIQFKSGIVSKIIDNFASGTERVPGLDTRDEYPLISLVKAINTERLQSRTPEFLIHAGDSAEVGTRGEVLRFVSIMNLLDIPWYGVLGNHDVLTFGNFAQTLNARNLPPNPGFIERRSEVMSLYQDAGFRGRGTSLYGRHQPTIDSDFIGPHSIAHGFDRGPGAGTLSTKYSLHVKSRPPIRIIGIDTNVPDIMIPTIAKHQLPAVGAGATTMNEDDFEWLEGEIKAARDEGEAVLVVGHHPLSNSRGPTFEYADGGSRKFLLKYLERQPNVLAYLGGHTHRVSLKLHDGIDRGLGSGLARLIAPSLHVYPQVALEVTILEKGGQLAIFATPIQGETKHGLAPALEEKINGACFGAIAEEKRLKVKGLPRQPDGTCWPVAEDIHSYSGLFRVGAVPHAIPKASITLADGHISTDVCLGDSVKIRVSLQGTHPWKLIWTDGVKDWNREVNNDEYDEIVTPDATREYTLKVIGDALEPRGKLPEAPIRINVRKLPEVEISGLPTACANTPVILTASGADEYLWSTGDKTPSITVKPNGDTSIRVTGTRAGCQKTKEKQLDVFKTDPVQIFGSAVACKGSAVTLTASPGQKYAWHGLQGVDLTSQSVTFGVKENIDISVDITDMNGCIATANRSLEALAPVTVRILGPEVVCAGDAIELAATPLLSTYQWSTGESSQTTTDRPTDTTTYKLTGIGKNKCPVRASKRIEVKHYPTATVLGGGRICEGATQRITAALTGIPPWELEWSDGFMQRIEEPSLAERIVETEGRYEVIHVHDASDCDGLRSGAAVVTVMPRPMVSISGPREVCATEPTTLIASGGQSYRWSTGETTDRIIIVPNQTTPYSVTAFTPEGCPGVATHTLEVLSSCQ